MSLATGRLATGTARVKTGVYSGTSIGQGLAPTSLRQIPEGKITATIYSLIRDSRFQDVIKILSNESTSVKTRPALSLLGYCYFQVQEYNSAADCYEELVKICPEVSEYRLYYAQALYKSGQYIAAQKACSNIEDPEFSTQVTKLEAAIRFELEDYAGCKTLVEQAPKDDPDSIANAACLQLKVLFCSSKEGNIETALKLYSETSKIVGFRPDLVYGMALSHYLLKNYAASLKEIAEIIERGIRDHPELSVGMATEGIEVRSVGNSQLLHQTYLIEAFNLKAAIEYNLKNYEAAKEALSDMPPRLEHELDQVTLHNQALMNMDVDVAGGFEKLDFLLQQSPCPQETFGNLLLLYVKYDFIDATADLLAENGDLAASTLSPYLYDFLDATLSKYSAPEDAYAKFDQLGDKHIDVLRKLTKQVQEARANHDEETIKLAVTEYEEAVNCYIPILMAQSKIYWDMGNYQMIEKIFRKSVEFCNENDVWKLNVAHVLFMQESKYKEAISFYEPAVKKHYDNILDVTAIVLANLCVSYIMTSQNEEAEDLMRRIEKEEERVAYEDPNKRTYHLCIVNLVIGTLYCSKGNYEFGITRIMKSLEPFSKKLGTDTWYYAKRCFAALFETLAKHTLVLKDSVFAEILEFFDNCEMFGRNIPVVIDPLASNNSLFRDSSEDLGSTSIASEARFLKSLFLRLYE